MECESPFSWLKNFRKLAGVLDILIGVAGWITIFLFTLTNRLRYRDLANGTEKLPFLASDLSDELSALDIELSFDVVLYVLPALNTLIVGVLVLLACTKDSFAWSKVAVTMNSVLILLCCGIAVVTFGLGIYWMRLIPLLLNIGIQLLVFGILMELYYSTQHKVNLR